MHTHSIQKVNTLADTHTHTHMQHVLKQVSVDSINSICTHEEEERVLTFRRIFGCVHV